MLKLERSGRGSQITIKLRERAPFLNSILWQAFLIAVLIHGGILLVFHIQPFVMKGEFHYSPTQLKTEKTNQILTVASEESPEDLYGIPPPPLDLFLNPLLINIDLPLTSPAIQPELLNQPFAELENHFIQYKAPDLPFLFTEAPIKVSFSDELGKLPLIKYDRRIDERVIFDASDREFLFAEYKVQVDEHNGKIFWYELQTPSGSKKIDALSEELLLGFEFAVPHPISRLSGTIHFALLSNKN